MINFTNFVKNKLNLSYMENDNLKNKTQYPSLYEFAKNHIKINDGSIERSFDDEELKILEEIQQM